MFNLTSAFDREGYGGTSRRRRVSAGFGAALVAGSLGLNGCGNGASVLNSPSAAAVALSGGVRGGQQPVTGSKVYLYAVSTAGYAGTATSLLNSPGYVTTDANGNFSITSDYSCPAGAYVYALSLGGNPGLSAGTNNPQLALMAGIGACSSLTSSSFITINEVTSIAMAYALAPFMASETKVGTSSTNLSGLQNAFGSIANLTNTLGAALATTPAGNGTPPQATLNTLGNALASCVNSNGVGAPCSTLMGAANVAGAGGTPIDTAQAAINIAHNPGTNVTAIYNLSTPNAVFQPTLPAVPNDLTLVIAYTANFSQVQGAAVDGAGNLYFSNSTGANMTELSPAGAVITPTSGLTSASMNRPQQIGIDLLGNVWTESRAFTATNGTVFAASVQKFSSNGTLLSGATGFTGSGLNTPRGLAIDASNNVWALGNSELSLFNNAGVALAPSGYTAANGAGNLQATGWWVGLDNVGNVWAAGYNTSNGAPSLTKFTPGALPAVTITGIPVFGNYQTQGLAFDASDNAWVAAYLGGSAQQGSVIEYSNSGALISPSAGFPTNAPTGNPNEVFTDGLGNVFTTQAAISEFSNSGAVLSPTAGYQPNQTDCCLTGAIDGSGNLWVTGSTHVFQIVGLAAPVVTPTVLAVKNGTQGQRP
jgi:hypothetical protein